MRWCGTGAARVPAGAPRSCTGVTGWPGKETGPHECGANSGRGRRPRGEAGRPAGTGEGGRAPRRGAQRLPAATHGPPRAGSAPRPGALHTALTEPVAPGSEQEPTAWRAARRAASAAAPPAQAGASDWQSRRRTAHAPKPVPVGNPLRVFQETPGKRGREELGRESGDLGIEGGASRRREKEVEEGRDLKRNRKMESLERDTPGREKKERGPGAEMERKAFGPREVGH